MEETNAYNEALIYEVRKHPWLYESGRPDYKDTFKRNNTWTKIDRTLNVGEGKSRKRWTSLRDQYQRKRREKFAYKPSGTGGGCRIKKWKFYELLESFLEPSIPAANPAGNLEDSFSEPQVSEPSCSGAVSHEEAFIDIEAESIAKGSVTENTNNENEKAPKKVKQINYHHELVKCLSAPDDIVDRSPQYHYCMSLIPRLKNLSPVDQGLVKIEIERIFLNVEAKLLDEQDGSN
ncbi:transcription factor Adf-1-like [Uloborus diversus]|uniref:transcription factor Adf-1-like n=1 Tax=Uloborus diversus TaxID=327109 RepID=UPI00240A2DB8|nr:transcription factor Adf-1-like [Uloborus diversus]